MVLNHFLRKNKRAGFKVAETDKFEKAKFPGKLQVPSLSSSDFFSMRNFNLRRGAQTTFLKRHFFFNNIPIEFQ